MRQQVATAQAATERTTPSISKCHGAAVQLQVPTYISAHRQPVHLATITSQEPCNLACLYSNKKHWVPTADSSVAIQRFAAPLQLSLPVGVVTRVAVGTGRRGSVHRSSTPARFIRFQRHQSHERLISLGMSLGVVFKNFAAPAVQTC